MMAINSFTSSFDYMVQYNDGAKREGVPRNQINSSIRFEYENTKSDLNVAITKKNKNNAAIGQTTAKYNRHPRDIFR